MALNADEEAWVDGLLDAFAANRNKASEWERGFLDDQAERFEEHAAETRFSPKQWSILDRVAYKLGYVKRQFDEDRGFPDE